MLHSRGLFDPQEGCVTYYGAKHLAESFRTVRKNTLAIAEEIPENKYGFRATPEVMSIGEMLAHLAVSPMWQIDVHTHKIPHLDFAMFAAGLQKSQGEQQALQTKVQIIGALKEMGSNSPRFSRGSTKLRWRARSASRPPCSRKRRRASRCSWGRRSTRCTIARS